jgi:hypothetical protein
MLQRTERLSLRDLAVAVAVMSLPTENELLLPPFHDAQIVSGGTHRAVGEDDDQGGRIQVSVRAAGVDAVPLGELERAERGEPILLVEI